MDVPTTMFKSIHKNKAWLFLVAVLSPATVSAQVWESGSVLTVNDQVISGRIVQEVDIFHIRVNEGNEVHLPRKQVKAVGNSLQELYQYKRKQLTTSARGGDHAQLARWCLRVGLLAEAGEHYFLLAQRHPAKDNPSVRQLGVEIKDKMLQQNDFRLALGLKPLDRQPNSTAATRPTTEVVPASSISTPSDSATLPGKINSQFSNQVQHILINRCGQAACHGHATSTPFRLWELTANDANNRSQANLQSVLKYISQDPKAKSALIEYLTKSHGPMHSPAIGPRESSLVNEVVAWVQLTQSPVVSAEAWTQPTELNPLNATAPTLRQVPRGSGGDFQAEFPEGADIPTAAELDQLDAEIHRQFEVQPAAGELDPFDPAEFNRRRTAEQRR
jgi:hypothetical protein